MTFRGACRGAPAHKSCSQGGGKKKFGADLQQMSHHHQVNSFYCEN